MNQRKFFFSYFVSYSPPSYCPSLLVVKKWLFGSLLRADNFRPAGSTRSQNDVALWACDEATSPSPRPLPRSPRHPIMILRQTRRQTRRSVPIGRTVARERCRLNVDRICCLVHFRHENNCRIWIFITGETASYRDGIEATWAPPGDEAAPLYCAVPSSSPLLACRSPLIHLNVLPFSHMNWWKHVKFDGVYCVLHFLLQVLVQSLQNFKAALTWTTPSQSQTFRFEPQKPPLLLCMLTQSFTLCVKS